MNGLMDSDQVMVAMGTAATDLAMGTEATDLAMGTEVMAAMDLVMDTGDMAAPMIITQEDSADSVVVDIHSLIFSDCLLHSFLIESKEPHSYHSHAVLFLHIARVVITIFRLGSQHLNL